MAVAAAVEEVPASEVVEAVEEVAAAVLVPASVSAEVAEVVAVGVGVVPVVAWVAAAPASVNTPVPRKAKRLRKHQRESLDPH